MQGSYLGFIDAYSQKNDFRMAAYHRLDISVQFHKKLKLWDQIIEISIYNVYNRANPYFYYIGPSSKNSFERVLKQMSLFPIIPSASYSFKF